MEITLFINGKERTFTAPFVSARMLRRTLEVKEKFEDGKVDPQALDFLVNYIVDLFGKQFTQDDLYDGLPASELMNTAMRCAREVMGGFANATSDLEEKKI